MNSTHSLDIYNITLLVDSHVLAKGTIPCFLKDLENILQVPLLVPFVLVVLANYWKMVVLAEKWSLLFFFFYLKVVTSLILVSG